MFFNKKLLCILVYVLKIFFDKFIGVVFIYNYNILLNL